MIPPRKNARIWQHGNTKAERLRRDENLRAILQRYGAQQTSFLCTNSIPMIEGLNNVQIAGRLTVSPSTIKSHVSNILSKLGVAIRTEAVTLALRNQIAP